jgi:bacillithiol biosynthesis cysteine-adding enzyme BshC
MTAKTLKRLKISNLFYDFLNSGGDIDKYVFTKDPAEVALNLKPDSIGRQIICDILIEQNRTFKSKSRTFDAIEKLRKDRTLCVFAGQQSGLLGGPLLTVYKMIDVVKRAAKLEDDLKRPVVPIFWIACDDHDYEEINHTFFLDREGELEKIKYEMTDHQAVPVADLCMSDENDYAAFKKQIENAITETEFSTDLLKRIKKTYSQGGNIVKAFALYLNDILPDMGLIIFCPHNKEIKRLSRNFFKQLIEMYFEVRDTIQDTNNELLNSGYHIQADKKESMVHLFYHNPERIPIHYIDDSFKMGDKTLGLTALLDLIERNPEKFSPDVLTRPIWQSYMFPVVAQIGGPSEIAYFCQIGKLFELFKMVQPYYYVRTGATLVEKRHEELLNKLNINIDDLGSDIEQLINKITGETLPEIVKEKIEIFRDKFEKDYDNFVKAVLDFDSNLEPMTEQTFGKIDFALNALEKKIYTAHKKKMNTVRTQIYKLAGSLYPDGKMQERVLNISYFLSKYGPGITKFIGRTLDVDNPEHQVIYLSQIEG